MLGSINYEICHKKTKLKVTQGLCPRGNSQRYSAPGEDLTRKLKAGVMLSVLAERAVFSLLARQVSYPAMQEKKRVTVEQTGEDRKR